MSSPVINHDMILEILSYFPVTQLITCRLLDKECNKRSYESWFLNLQSQRTKSISGYLLRCRLETSFIHERGDLEKNGVSIDFLRQGKAKIKACDSSHGILLCVDNTGPGKAEYIVCKPTTKQYQIIPNPIVSGGDTSLALTVTGLNPFRYKIHRLSKAHGMSFRTYTCEVFDSVSFTWKRLKILRLGPGNCVIGSTLVQVSGFLYWLTSDKRVVRFCLKTETWTSFQTPKFGVCPELVKYKGKLGVLRWWLNANQEGIHRLWVLESNSKKSWHKVKDLTKEMGFGHNILLTPRDNIVVFYGWDRFCFYNLDTEEYEIVHTYLSNEYEARFCFQFCSDYERIVLDNEIL